MGPDIVPDKLENKINFKIIILIISAIVGFQISLFYLQEETRDDLVYIISIINPTATSIVSFIAAKRYVSKVFGRAYFCLGFGYLSAAIAEFLYYVYEKILDVKPYPSVADIFFFALYPLLLTHLILNVRFFKPKINVREAAWMIAIPVAIISTYILASNYGKEINFEFYYGLIFVIEPAVVLPFAILGAKTFRGGIIGTAWIILVLSIIALTIGDVWYYYMEIYDQYTLLHPVNLFWYCGYWIGVYALYKHKESI